MVIVTFGDDLCHV